MIQKEYIGDSVYCSHDGFQFVLTTENGRGVTNEIFLDWHVVQGFFRQIEKVHGIKIRIEQLKKEGEQNESPSC